MCLTSLIVPLCTDAGAANARLMLGGTEDSIVAPTPSCSKSRRVFMASPIGNVTFVSDQVGGSLADNCPEKDFAGTDEIDWSICHQGNGSVHPYGQGHVEPAR
jgi:hypothetical protein